MNDFGLYVVMTNPVVGYAKCAEAAVKAGVRIIQLRMKHAAEEEIIHEAGIVREITRNTNTLFIVNDSPEIASYVGADGVHIGQDDMPAKEVRRCFPRLKVIGLSTHNISQVQKSLSESVDYIGVGPVYATPTKDIPDPTLGLRTMKEMIELSSRPAVAIGGIDAVRIKSVVESGARNVAVVRAVCESPNPEAAIMELKKVLMT